MTRSSLASLVLIVAAWLGAVPAFADVQILLPQNRTAFQTNEWIDVSVVRSSDKELAEGKLSLLLEGLDGSKVATTFAAPIVKAQNNKAAATMHLHLSGWLLRPGKYKLSAAVDGGKAATDIEVYSHIRQSSFKLINWGLAKGKEQLAQGEDGLGFNTFYGHYGQDEDANFIRGGIDYIANCVMSGGHQMDLRLECDWSDPLVIRGGTRRVVRRAMMDRTRPNVPGVHFYDEPGLTWGENPETKEFTPHAVKAQAASYKAAFGKDPLPYTKVDPKNPEHVEAWKHWITWRLGFMDAAWRDSQFGVSSVRPDFLSLTQSQYGFSAFTDGYYFNVARSLPVTSGHGGYHDFGPGVFNPSYFMEIARARDYWKPCWYLPTWYGNTTNDQFRCEQYLSIQTHLQGMICPPDLEPATNSSARAAIVETNQLMKRLGPIFTTMPVTRPPVAMLYSLSQAIHTQTQDRKRNYLHEMPQGANLPFTYLAGKLIQQPFLCVLDEDILDGTVGNDHQAIVLTSIDYLDPGVVKALEDFAQRGGLVLLTGDSTVQIKGVTKLNVVGRLPDQELINKLQKEKGREKELESLQSTAKYLEGAKALAKAIQAELAKKKIKPVFDCDNPHIVATRQAAGEIEYFFAVNATPDGNDPKDVRTALKSAEANIQISSAPVIYDAIVGGGVPELKPDKGGMTGKFRFGAGQMRVFAVTSRPIGIRLATPQVTRDLVLEKEPISVDIAATVVDDKGRTVSGSVPLHVQVIDPLGALRHEVFRATKLGQFSVRLPLAANDPPGKWKVVVHELLNNSDDTMEFTYQPPVRARAIAGETHRAVMFGEDANNIFRFARAHHEVTIIKGSSAFNDAAVQRLTKILEPWGIKCKTMDLKEAAKSRKLTDDEAKTWVGLTYAGKGQIKPGEANPPILAGFAVQGPVILLGNPGDNPIIDFLHKEKFLPYNPDAQKFPGTNRGYIAWQRDGIGANQESVALIGYDEAGIQEAVGTFYEAVAGIEPLTKWKLPESDAILPADDGKRIPRMEVAWTAKLPDRVVGLKEVGQALVALSYDGTRADLGLEGKEKARQVLPAADLSKAMKELAPDNSGAEVAKKFARTDRMANFSTAAAGKVAIAHWGGTLRVVDDKGTVLAEKQLPQDISAMTWVGDQLVIGLADGRVQAPEDEVGLYRSRRVSEGRRRNPSLTRRALKDR